MIPFAFASACKEALSKDARSSLECACSLKIVVEEEVNEGEEKEEERLGWQKEDTLTQTLKPPAKGRMMRDSRAIAIPLFWCCSIMDFFLPVVAKFTSHEGE